MRERLKIIKKNWKKAFNNKKFVYEFFLSLVVLTLVRLVFSTFSVFVELRNGVQFTDPFLANFIAINLTGFIFAMIYGSILLCLLILLNSPFRLIILFEAYALMVLIRVSMMYVLPLLPPEGMVSLKDPFVEVFGTGKTLVNDLFFSGHTATMFLLFLSVPKKYKSFFLLMTFLVAIGVILQKVHYSVDVMVAPFISFGTYSLIKYSFIIRYKNCSKK